MRMTLNEIASMLGCKREDVLWNPETWQKSGKGFEADGVPYSPVYTPEPSSGEEEHPVPWWGVFPQGAQIDSRAVRSGDLFFCIKGNTVDGHDFAADAIALGASAIIAERDPFAGKEIPVWEGGVVPSPVFLVPDSVQALQRLALCHRDTSMSKVVGITGTAGKTSVKDVLAHVLAQRGQTERSPLNRNNSIGLPLSILNASPFASFWVMEAGISLPQDMDELGNILHPDIALILNVGLGHTEGLGDKGVAHYKAKLLEYITPYGTGVYSMDYPELRGAVEALRPQLQQNRVELLAFSGNSCDVFCRAVYKGTAPGGMGEYHVLVENHDYTLAAPFRGEMGAENVAAIVTVALKLGLSIGEIAQGLRSAVLPEQRFSLNHLQSFTLVDDSYNANPLSSRRMIQVVQEIAAEQQLPLIFIMGEMGELGVHALQAHEQLGRYLAKAMPKAVFWKGEQVDAVRRGLVEEGYKGAFYAFSGLEEFSNIFHRSGCASGLVLIKGSRMNRLEELVHWFHTNYTDTKDD